LSGGSGELTDPPEKPSAHFGEPQAPGVGATGVQLLESSSCLPDLTQPNAPALALPVSGARCCATKPTACKLIFLTVGVLADGSENQESPSFFQKL